MRHPISVQPQSTYQSSNNQLRIIIIVRRHIGAYHGPDLVFHPVTVMCNITCASFEVMCSCRVVVLWGFLGCARENRNTIVALTLVSVTDASSFAHLSALFDKMVSHMMKHHMCIKEVHQSSHDPEKVVPSID